MPIISGGGGGGGGSQPSLSLIDGGTHTIAQLLNGPATIYTPAAGVEVWAALISAYAVVDNGFAIMVSTAALIDGHSALARLGATAGTVEDSFGQIYNGDVPDGSTRLYPVTDPVVVYAVLGNGALPVDPAGPWHAATSYSNGLTGSNIVMVGHMWHNTGNAGVSGNVQPDFAGNIGGSVADGVDIIWQDQGAVPTTGSATVRLIVGRPA